MENPVFTLIVNAQKGDRNAFDELIKQNSGLIWSIARRFFGRGVDLEDLKQAIKAYCRGKRPYDYLFPSRKGGHIGRVQAYKIMRDVADVFKLDSIGTHTMRKTFGYHFIKNGGSIEVLMEILGHSDPAVTRRYIGITSEETRSAVKNFSFFK